METLYQIDKSIGQILETGFAFDEETGEILFDESDLEALEVAYQDKVEACAMFIKNRRALVNALKDEEKALQARRKAAEAQVKRIEGYLSRHSERLPEKGLETPKAKVSFRKSQRVSVFDEAALPEEYVRTKVITEPDKRAIGKALKEGEYIPGAALVFEKNLSVK